VKLEEPVQVPLVDERVWPRVVVPEITGKAVLTGLVEEIEDVAALTALVFAAGGLVPVAVILTLTVQPVSASCKV